jgi:hypothetical protein
MILDALCPENLELRHDTKRSLAFNAGLLCSLRNSGNGPANPRSAISAPALYCAATFPVIHGFSPQHGKRRS